MTVVSGNPILQVMIRICSRSCPPSRRFPALYELSNRRLLRHGDGFLLFSVISGFLSLTFPCSLRTIPRRASSLILSSNRFTPKVMTVLDGVNGTVCSAEQYRQFLQPSDHRSPSITCLTHGESIGLAVSFWLVWSLSRTHPMYS